MGYDTECSIDPATGQPAYFWLTRNRCPETGELESFCDIWWVRPVMRSRGLGAVWDNSDVTPEGSHMYGWQGRYDLQAVLKWCRVLPDDHRQLIVVGRRD